MVGFDLVVANYNNGRYLDQLIQSVELQSCPNWHLHIVDDNSTDESHDVLRKYAAHNKISIIRHRENLGVCSTFHDGIMNGQRPYIGLIGADDSLQPACIDLCTKEFQQQPDASMIYTQAYKCDEQLNILGTWEQTQPIDYTKAITAELPKIFNFICFRRASYAKTKGLDVKLRKAMDHDLTLKLSRVGRIHYLPRKLYNYRCHSQGISQGNSGLLAAQFSLLCQINHLKETKDSTYKDLRALQHLYHSRTGFIGKSCDKHSPLFHAALSIGYSINFKNLKTSISAILKSIRK